MLASDMRDTFRLVTVFVTLMIPAVVAGSETIDRFPDLTDLITDYADAHIPRGEIVVGVSYDGVQRWYSTGSLTPETTFEIGSITKTVTGMLFAERIASGRVAPTTTVEDLWPTGPQAEASGIPRVPEQLAGITLMQLATHTSGLPRLNFASWRMIRTLFHLNDPYARLTSTDVYRDAAAARIDRPGEFRYSNLGFALLGQLLSGVLTVTPRPERSRCRLPTCCGTLNSFTSSRRNSMPRSDRTSRCPTRVWPVTAGSWSAWTTTRL